MGGQSRVDTSDYMAAQVQRYNIFDTVVPFLKILLEQVKSGKPFI